MNEETLREEIQKHFSFEVLVKYFNRENVYYVVHANTNLGMSWKKALKLVNCSESTFLKNIRDRQ